MFAKLGNVRSLLPDKVNILALTATATRNILECITSRLAMDKPTVIGLPPDRPNIKLSVQSCPSIATLCKQLTDEIKENALRQINIDNQKIKDEIIKEDTIYRIVAGSEEKSIVNGDSFKDSEVK